MYIYIIYIYIIYIYIYISGCLHKESQSLSNMAGAFYIVNLDSKGRE